VRDRESTLRELLTFLGLDAGSYEFAAARDLPVFGFSTFRGDRADLYWEPVDKSEAFQPLARSRGWNAPLRRRFAWLAGDLMHRLGVRARGGSIAPRRLAPARPRRPLGTSRARPERSSADEAPIAIEDEGQHCAEECREQPQHRLRHPEALLVFELADSGRMATGAT
jgi:hypothetical protein